MTRRSVAFAGAMLLMSTVAVLHAQSAAQPKGGGRSAETRDARGQPKDIDPLKDFKARLDAYIKLRSDLADKLKPLSPTGSAAELASRQESLAAAIRESRKGAKKGDLIPIPVADAIRAVIAEDLKARTAEARKAAFAEVPAVAVVINKTYPAQAALPTVPPLLLNRLPPLPDNLQYRFAGRHLVILDGDTQIMIDYVEGVLPPP